MSKLLVAVAVAALVATITLGSNVPVKKLGSAHQRARQAAKMLGPHAPAFFVFQTGPGSVPENNTVLATFWDIQSKEFVDFFNFNQGLPVDPNTDMSGCCLFSISEGFLIYREDVEQFQNFTYVAPYQQGQHVCASQLSGNVMFGGIEGLGPEQGVFFGNLTENKVARMAYYPRIKSAVGCPASPQSFGIYKTVTPPPLFIATGIGSDFPTPPAGYVTASVSDLQSQAFIDLYNSGGLMWKAPGPMNGCCVFQLADGFWTNQAGDWLSIFTSQGAFDCSVAPANPIGLGYCVDVGPDQGQFLPTLTMADAKTWNTAPTLDPTLGCGQPADTFSIAMLSP